MLLIILPLAKKGKEVKQKVIEQVVDLAKQIEDENTQVFVITGILVSSDKFIDRDYAKSVRRYLSMTKVFQSLEEEKLEAVNIAKRNERHDTNVEIAKSLLRDGIDTVVIMRATGFSKEQIEEAQKYCKIEAFQPQYSLADRKDEKLIRWAYEQGLGIMTYGTLGGGILTGNYRKLRTFEQTDSRNRFYPYFKEPLFSKAMELLTIMDQIAEERNVSLAQIAEKWVIQKRFVSSCIIGAQSRARVEENCRNLQWELTDNEIRRLESVRIL